MKQHRSFVKASRGEPKGPLAEPEVGGRLVSLLQAGGGQSVSWGRVELRGAVREQVILRSAASFQDKLMTGLEHSSRALSRDLFFGLHPIPPDRPHRGFISR